VCGPQSYYGKLAGNYLRAADKNTDFKVKDIYNLPFLTQIIIITACSGQCEKVNKLVIYHLL
jgi:hypothetical protein